MDLGRETPQASDLLARGVRVFLLHRLTTRAQRLPLSPHRLERPRRLHRRHLERFARELPLHVAKATKGLANGGVHGGIRCTVGVLLAGVHVHSTDQQLAANAAPPVPWRPLAR